MDWVVIYAVRILYKTSHDPRTCAASFPLSFSVLGDALIDVKCTCSGFMANFFAALRILIIIFFWFLVKLVNLQADFNPLTTKNLEIVLSNLTSASTTNPSFHNSRGQNKDKVYGLYLCRGDLIPEACSSFVLSVTWSLAGALKPQKGTPSPPPPTSFIFNKTDLINHLINETALAITRHQLRHTLRHETG